MKRGKEKQRIRVATQNVVETSINFDGCKHQFVVQLNCSPPLQRLDQITVSEYAKQIVNY